MLAHFWYYEILCDINSLLFVNKEKTFRKRNMKFGCPPFLIVSLTYLPVFNVKWRRNKCEFPCFIYIYIWDNVIHLFFRYKRYRKHLCKKDFSFTLYAVRNASNDAFTGILIHWYQYLRLLSYTDSINTILICDLKDIYRHIPDN